MQNRILSSYTNQDTSTSINFFEICRWFFFYAFLESIVPFFLDPLQLTGRLFDIPILDWFELLYFIIIPNFVIFLSAETSPFASTYGLLLYLLITSSPFVIIYRYLFQDFFAVACMLPVFYEFLAVDASEESYYED